ncbi:MetQ/NlpA family ABC transporter substrate-binding protein [Gilliamella apicola]|uniref:Metal ABC transporter substrate-binding protein n=1 Tax=Gilliamella apicola TaxID=1196095 RepID=A0A2V4E706_9GAMM|nr:MetQ/NlpA family ABC transporter substrate-binding protein [Gilliamella apicola]PXZ04157.1 metal ABC transporter substrate-binding protein [Gilliamella apicola]
MKKYIYIFILLGFILQGCDNKSDSSHTTQQDKKEIVVGLPPSMHNIMMEKVVKPALEKQGYKVRLVNFSSLRDSNTALVEGSIDLNAAQHQSYLDVYNKETKSDLVSLVHIPSISAALFSQKHHSINEIADGQTILIPNDPANQARSLQLLQSLHWITLKSGSNVGILDLNAIDENKYNLKFKAILSEMMPRILNEVDYAIMPGGIAWLSHIPADNVLVQEKLTANLELMVVVKKENLNTKWAQDVKQLYQSDALKKFINQDPDAKGRFIWPQQ